MSQGYRLVWTSCQMKGLDRMQSQKVETAHGLYAEDAHYDTRHLEFRRAGMSSHPTFIYLECYLCRLNNKINIFFPDYMFSIVRFICVNFQTMQES